METGDDLAHPIWLRDAISNPTKIWNSWSLLTDREAQRTAASKRSRETYEPDEDDSPFGVVTGALEDNRRKNRFGIEAYDRNRVILSDPDRYVNASYVREGAGGRWWVVAEVYFLLSVNYLDTLPITAASSCGISRPPPLPYMRSYHSLFLKMKSSQFPACIPSFSLPLKAKARHIPQSHTFPLTSHMLTLSTPSADLISRPSKSKR